MTIFWMEAWIKNSYHGNPGIGVTVFGVHVVKSWTFSCLSETCFPLQQLTVEYVKNRLQHDTSFPSRHLNLEVKLLPTYALDELPEKTLSSATLCCITRWLIFSVLPYFPVTNILLNATLSSYRKLETLWWLSPTSYPPPAMALLPCRFFTTGTAPQKARGKKNKQRTVNEPHL